MPRYELTAPDGRTVVVEGDRPPTQEDAARIFAQIQVKPERTFGEKVGGAFDVAANMATGAVAQPLSGLVGLANLAVTQDPASAAARQQQVESALTYKPGEVGQEYLQDIGSAPVIKQIGETALGAGDYAGRKTMDITGSPTLASIAKGSLDATGAALGAFVPGGLATRQATKTGEKMISDIRSAKSELGMDIDDAPSLRDTDTAKAMRKTFGKEKSIANVINSDPEFYSSLERLGITAEPLAGYGSRNPQYVAIEGAFSAIPGSPANLLAKRFAVDVSNVAQALLEKGGASLDSVQKSMDWRRASMKTIDELGDAGEKAYDALNDVIDKKAPMVETNTLDFINELVADLPAGINDPSVPPVIKKVYRSLQPRKVTGADGDKFMPANYASLDMERKKIGAAAFQKEGQFKDAEKAILSKLYSTLSDDTNAIALAQGLDEQAAAAKALISQRKQLEEGMKNLLGDNLRLDVIPVVQSGLRGLSKGGAKRYQDLMRNIPEQEVRRELITTALNDMFKKTTGGEQQFGTTDYLKWYNDTLKNDSVRGLIGRDLEKETLQVLDDLAVVAEGVAKSSNNKISTGVVNAVLNDDMGVIRRMVSVAGRGSRATPVVGSLTEGMNSAIIELAERSTKRAEATANLIATPEFLTAVRRGVALGVMDGKKATDAVKLADKRLKNTAKFKDWEATLKPEEHAKLNAIGLTAYLLAPEQEQEND